MKSPLAPLGLNLKQPQSFSLSFFKKKWVMMFFIFGCLISLAYSGGAGTGNASPKSNPKTTLMSPDSSPQFGRIKEISSSIMSSSSHVSSGTSVSSSSQVNISSEQYSSSASVLNAKKSTQENKTSNLPLN